MTWTILQHYPEWTYALRTPMHSPTTKAGTIGFTSEGTSPGLTVWSLEYSWAQNWAERMDVEMHHGKLTTQPQQQEVDGPRNF